MSGGVYVEDDVVCYHGGVGVYVEDAVGGLCAVGGGGMPGVSAGVGAR